MSQDIGDRKSVVVGSVAAQIRGSGFRPVLHDDEGASIVEEQEGSFCFHEVSGGPADLKSGLTHHDCAVVSNTSHPKIGRYRCRSGGSAARISDKLSPNSAADSYVMRDARPMKIRRSVWIVQHHESPPKTILGVFPSGEEATAFAEEVKEKFENGVLTAQFALGYRFDENSARYAAGDET